MALSDVLGQEHAALCLRSALRRERVASAYLFQGPEGVGKAKMAIEFAKLLFCPHGGDEACGACGPCRLMEAGSHPDLHVFQPAEGRRFITVEQVRDLSRVVFTYPVQGTWKVIIVRDADDLRDDAQNMLLKTLEEPPADTVIILVTARPHRLVSPILSRCQCVRFAPLGIDHVRTILARLSKEDEETIQFAAGYAAGSVAAGWRVLSAGGRAARDGLLDAIAALAPETAFEVAGAIYRGVEGSAVSAELEGRRDAARFYLDMLGRLYRDVLVISDGAADVALFNPDRRARLEEISRRLGSAGAAEAADRILEARADVDGNANIRLALENALSGVARIAAR